MSVSCICWIDFLWQKHVTFFFLWQAAGPITGLHWASDKAGQPAILAIILVPLMVARLEADHPSLQEKPSLFSVDYGAFAQSLVQRTNTHHCGDGNNNVRKTLSVLELFTFLFPLFRKLLYKFFRFISLHSCLLPNKPDTDFSLWILSNSIFYFLNWTNKERPPDLSSHS